MILFSLTHVRLLNRFFLYERVVFKLYLYLLLDRRIFGYFHVLRFSSVKTTISGANRRLRGEFLCCRRVETCHAEEKGAPVPGGRPQEQDTNQESDDGFGR